MMYSEMRRKYSSTWLIIGATFAALGCGNVIAPTAAVELSMSAFRSVADSVISLPGLDDLREGDILSAELVVRNIGEDMLVISEFAASLFHRRDADGQTVPDFSPLNIDRVAFDPPLEVPLGESTKVFWNFTITPEFAQNPGIYALSFTFMGIVSLTSTSIEITAP